MCWACSCVFYLKNTPNSDHLKNLYTQNLISIWNFYCSLLKSWLYTQIGQHSNYWLLMEDNYNKHLSNVHSPHCLSLSNIAQVININSSSQILIFFETGKSVNIWISFRWNQGMTQWIIIFSLLATVRTKQFQVYLSMFINPIVCIGDQGLSVYLKITISQWWFAKKNSAGKTSLAMARHCVTTNTFRENQPPRPVSCPFPRQSSSSLGQGLAGSWGQDTDQAGTFWGVLNVSLPASGTQFGYKLTWNHKRQPGIMKDHKELIWNLKP